MSETLTARASEHHDAVATTLTVGFHGVRGSTPCHCSETSRYGGNTSCVSVHADDASPLIFDLGTGVRYTGIRADAGRPLHVVCLLTHLHLDHIMGLPFFEPLLSADTTLDIYAPRQDDGASVTELLHARFAPPTFPVRLAEFAATIRIHEIGDDDFEVAGWHVRSRYVPHVGPTLGFRVHRAGVSVTYLSDHQQPDGDEFTIAAGARDVCADTDLLIHDAQYTDAEFAAKKTWGHSTHGYAAWVARTSGARRLALFHHDPSRRDADLDELGSAHRAGAVPSIVAREGMRLAVSSQA